MAKNKKKEVTIKGIIIAGAVVLQSSEQPFFDSAKRVAKDRSGSTDGV